jgi:hypothetical protein
MKNLAGTERAMQDDIDEVFSRQREVGLKNLIDLICSL